MFDGKKGEKWTKMEEREKFPNTNRHGWGENLTIQENKGEFQNNRHCSAGKSLIIKMKTVSTMRAYCKLNDN